MNYTAIDDFGTVINPMIVEGQVHGGVAQGVQVGEHVAAEWQGGKQGISHVRARVAGNQACSVPTVGPGAMNLSGVRFYPLGQWRFGSSGAGFACIKNRVDKRGVVILVL